MHTGEITINVNSKKMENTVDRQDLDKIVLFHIALINKQSIDVYMHSMESGILVIAKYCEQNQLCVTVKVNTKGLLLQNMISVPFKTVLEKNITFKLNKENFLVTFSPRKSKNSTIARLPAINLNGYALVAGLGYPNFARTTLAFGNLTMSCRVHKKIHLSTDFFQQNVKKFIINSYTNGMSMLFEIDGHTSLQQKMIREIKCF